MTSSPEIIRQGRRVAIRYQLRNAAGKLLEESGQEPSIYTHGSGTLVAGLRDALSGRKVGERFEIEVQASEGYGEPVASVGPQPIPRGTFPESTKLVVGMEFLAETPDGDPMTLYITDLTEQAVFVDKNHPFAGMTLHYSVEVVAILPAETG